MFDVKEQEGIIASLEMEVSKELERVRTLRTCRSKRDFENTMFELSGHFNTLCGLIQTWIERN